MVKKCIIIKKQKYFLYDCYDSWESALKIAKYKKKKNKCRYFIVVEGDGLPLESDEYYLYLNKCIKIW